MADAGSGLGRQSSPGLRHVGDDDCSGDGSCKHDQVDPAHLCRQLVRERAEVASAEWLRVSTRCPCGFCALRTCLACRYWCKTGTPSLKRGSQNGSASAASVAAGESSER